MCTDAQVCSGSWLSRESHDTSTAFFGIQPWPIYPRGVSTHIARTKWLPPLYVATYRVPRQWVSGKCRFQRRLLSLYWIGLFCSSLGTATSPPRTWPPAGRGKAVGLVRWYISIITYHHTLTDGYRARPPRKRSLAPICWHPLYIYRYIAMRSRYTCLFAHQQIRYQIWALM